MAQSIAEKSAIEESERGVVSKLKIARGRREDRLELLERMDATGSISATAMDMRYKAA
ncbi:MAG: hypothetical protein Q8J80_11385 [Gallionella sp.]|nr:hypothetical protein [Gallionella sp.]